MKKSSLLLLILSLLLCTLFAQAAFAEAISVDSIQLNKTKATIYIPNTLQLTANVSPITATDKTILWTSTDSAIATVSGDGLVTAKSAGKATITATTVNGKTQSCAVTVSIKKVTSVSLPKKTSIKTGSTKQLTAKLSPASASIQDIKWSSNKQNIVTVSEDGLITALKTGTAKITAKSHNGKKAVCVVTVKPIAATGVTLSESRTNMVLGDKYTILATVVPDNTTNKKLTYKSSNKKVASVNSQGIVSAKQLGTATITIQTHNKKTAKCVINVAHFIPIPATGISLSPTSMKLAVNGVKQLTATVTPGDAHDQMVSWTSQNPAVATVTNGLVKAVALGTTTITAKTSNNLTAACQITVAKGEPLSISLNKTSLSLEINETQQLTATVLPEDAEDKSVSWTSDNTSVATVSNGLVKAIGAGSTTITAISSNNLTVACQVTVAKNEPLSVSLNKTSLSLEINETQQLTATVLPEDAQDKSISWTSDNTSVATVSNGLVKAIGAGSTKITAKTSNNLTAACQITVAAAPVAPKKYFFYGIGNSNYPESLALPSCAKDIQAMNQLFSSARFSGTSVTVKTVENLTGEGIRNLLNEISTNSNITENDVTYFYYSGHGLSSSNAAQRGALYGIDKTPVLVSTVQLYLDQIPGQVVVILDSCLSGQFVESKGIDKKASMIAYNQAIIESFKAANVRAKALTNSTVKDKYKIMTACSPTEDAWAFAGIGSLMTLGIQDALAPNLPADNNSDNLVSLSELFTYTNSRVKEYLQFEEEVDQNMMVWPVGDNTTVYARN